MERISKEKREKILDRIKKAGDSENYETSWNEEGAPYKIKNKAEIKKGKRSRAAGARFELKVRSDLESKGWSVDKWNNNVDLDKNELVIAKRKYNPFKKMLVVGTGFPDFISIKPAQGEFHSVVGIEVKRNGILSKIEKEKCVWYLKKGIFSKVWVAKAVKNGRKIDVEYDDFFEKYGNKYLKK